MGNGVPDCAAFTPVDVREKLSNYDPRRAQVTVRASPNQRAFASYRQVLARREHRRDRHAKWVHRQQEAEASQIQPNLRAFNAASYRLDAPNFPIAADR